ncbi:MAG TPA: MBOAT family O-acyltransferase [Candidatus Obscuribacterales bacterium]
MLFNSISYFIFFPVVLIAYWASPFWLKKPVLLIASYLFYMNWIPKYGILVAALTLFNYVTGLAIEKFRQKSKVILVAGLVANLACLVYFKYIDFFLATIVDSTNCITSALHLPIGQLHARAFDVILPLGISFFVFEFIHYLVDVAKGTRAVRNPVDFALFAAFFPSQIAGPIKRFQDFLQQINPADGSAIRLRSHDLRAGIALILQGLFKKVAIADNLAVIVNAGFHPAVNLSTTDAWIAATGFALQIYFDFSGYTDMGRGSALMLGISLPDNFNFPYLAMSISDFWRRWHISLSTWLRDYLYIPLGGGRAHKIRNLLLTMLLGGLWHGAATHFVIWGAYHGCLLALNHKYDDLVAKTGALRAFHGTSLGRLLSVMATFFMVLSGWVLFRADTMPQALSMVHNMLIPNTHHGVLSTMLERSPVIAALLLYGCYALLYSLPKFMSFKLPDLRPTSLIGWAARLPIYAAVAFAVVGFAPVQPSSFIYFQF